MLSDFLYTKVFLYELQSFIALFIGEEKKNSLYGFLHPPISVPLPPPPPNPRTGSSVFPIPTALRINNRFGLRTGASGRKIS